jgi:hypothetical protein
MYKNVQKMVRLIETVYCKQNVWPIFLYIFALNIILSNKYFYS